MTIHLDDYHVITSLLVGHPYRWSWEICRKSTPLGVKMTGDGYQSDTAAQFAGKSSIGCFSVRFSKRRKTPQQVRPPQLAASFMIALTTGHAAHGLPRPSDDLRCYRRSPRIPTPTQAVRF